jgi:hypothetical protein
MGTVPRGSAVDRFLWVAVYVVIFVLGAVQGLVGSFTFALSPVPLVAILLAAAILATCALAGLGTGSFGGALAPGAGWLIVSYLLATGTHTGSVAITNTAAGKWYLYGGTLSVLVGCLVAFVLLTRSRLRAH